MNMDRIETAGKEWGKADFDRIYQCADPREYFRVLGGLDYVIPDLTRDIFRSLLDHSSREGRDSRKVVDLGCSYGINSALISYPVDLHRLAQRYASPEMQRLSSDELIKLDRRYFSAWPKRKKVHFVGVDTSAAAVSYAREVGLLNAGVTSDLEAADPKHTEAAALDGADLIISTGCVGYITERSFLRIIKCQTGGRLPVFASFVLRMFPYDEIAAALSPYGMVTEKLEGVTFVQRRFSSSAEFSSAMDRLERCGIDPTGKEADGLMHAELFITRTKEAAERFPLNEIISITSGADRRYGRRFRRIDESRSLLMQ
jgi:SAM-dependent methyltransferase